MRPTYFDHQTTMAGSPLQTLGPRTAPGRVVTSGDSITLRITAESWRRRQKPPRRSDNLAILRGC